MPAGSADVTTFRKYIYWHRDALSKTSNDDIKQDDSELEDVHEGQWAVLMDKCYQGLVREIRSIPPSKKNCGFLSTKDRQRNQKIASDRTIVEKYFERETQLWSMLDQMFSLPETIYDTVINVCRSLKNFHVTHQPLHEEDHAFFQQQLRRVYAEGMRREWKRKLDAKNCSTKRDRRLQIISQHGDAENGSVVIDVFDDVTDFVEYGEEENAEVDVEEYL